MKCPICGLDFFLGKCPHNSISLIKEIAKLNKMLGSNQLGCEKEIERLKKRITELEEEIEIHIGEDEEK